MRTITGNSAQPNSFSAEDPDSMVKQSEDLAEMSWFKQLLLPTPLVDMEWKCVQQLYTRFIFFYLLKKH